MNNLSSGVALRCSLDGRIQEIIRDQIGLSEMIAVKSTLARAVDPLSVGKALSFLQEIKETGAAFNWELNVPLAHKIATVHFAGIRIENVLFVVGSDQVDGVSQQYEDLLKMQNTQLTAMRVLLKNSTRSPVTATVSDDHRSFDQLSHLNNELINVQRELAQKNAKLEELNQLKNLFLGMASHDLRNPVSRVYSASSYLLETSTGNLSDIETRFLEIIYSSSVFMTELLDDLLDMTSIESGKSTLNLQLVEIEEFVLYCVDVNRLLIEAKEIDIETDFAPDLPVLMLDRTKMEQVLNNLLSNATKYSYPQTTIRVKTAVIENVVIIEIQDEGQGIPQAALETLFEPFATSSVKTTGGETSTGLGLSIVKRVVERHDGRIWVESTVGVGSSFFVALPVPESQ